MLFDHEAIKALSATYQENGLGDTSSGRFLKNLAETGKPPRGRGITWLEELMTKPLPIELLNEAKDLDKLAQLCDRPSLAETLRDFASKLKRGHQLSDRQKSFIAFLKKEAGSPSQRAELTDLDRALLAGISARIASYSPFAYSKLSRSVERVSKILSSFKTDGCITEADFKYVTSKHKGLTEAWYSLQDTLIVGSLWRWKWPQGSIGGIVMIVAPIFFDRAGKIYVDIMPSDGSRLSVDVNSLKPIERKRRSSKVAVI